MKKVYIVTVIVIFIILSLLLLFFITRKSNDTTKVGNIKVDITKYFLGTIIIKDDSTNTKTIRIDDETKLNEDTLTLSTNDNLDLGDRIKVSYKIDNNNIQIIKVEKYTDTEKYKNIFNIMNDKKLNTYKESIKMTANKKDISFFVLPKKLDGITYKSMNYNEFIDVYNHVYDGILSTTKKDINIEILINDFKIEEIYNINQKNTIQLNYTQKDGAYNINSLGEGVYILKLQHKNGDIIDIIFM